MQVARQRKSEQSVCTPTQSSHPFFTGVYLFHDSFRDSYVGWRASKSWVIQYINTLLLPPQWGFSGTII